MYVLYVSSFCIETRLGKTLFTLRENEVDKQPGLGNKKNEWWTKQFEQVTWIPKNFTFCFRSVWLNLKEIDKASLDVTICDASLRYITFALSLWRCWLHYICDVIALRYFIICQMFYFSVTSWRHFTLDRRQKATVFNDWLKPVNTERMESDFQRHRNQILLIRCSRWVVAILKAYSHQTKLRTKTIKIKE